MTERDTELVEHHWSIPMSVLTGISSCSKPRFCSVVEILAQPMINLDRLAAGVKKPVGVSFLR